jgi:hypothetical protein
LSTFPDGLFQYGGQPVGAIWASPWSTVRFVDGGDGNDNNSGLKPTEAKKTIQSAVTASGRSDVIYVRPKTYVVGTGMGRYSEDVTTALTQNDLSIIGTVNTTNPEFGVRWKPETATAITNIAPAFHLENLGFYAEDLKAVSLLSNGVTDTQRGIDGTTLYNVCIKGGGMTVADGGTGLRLERVRFSPKYNGEVDNAFTYTCNVAPGRMFTMKNCEFMDGNGTACDDQWISLVGVITEVIIRDCYFGQVPTGNAYIVAAAGVEGLIANCYFAAANGSTTAIEQGGMFTVACNDVTGLGNIK